jgi:sterol desaturase/sphingolipid hydroxylase (fatty acid hydroxylase superfamily)
VTEIWTELALSVAIGTATALFFIGTAMSAEHLMPLGKRVSMKARKLGLLFALIQPGLSVLAIAPVQAFYSWAGIPTLIPLTDWLSPLGWAAPFATGLVLLLLIDFLAYWRHRAEHRWFWSIHVLHHCPTDLHAANSYGHPTQVLIGAVFVVLPLSLIDMGGFELPLMIGLLVSFLQVFIHSPTEFHFGPLRRVFVDNRFHRIHHSLEPRHFDRNFSILFSFWDRIFGTAYFPEEGEWPDVGVAGSPPPQTVREFLAYPITTIRAQRSQVKVYQVDGFQTVTPVSTISSTHGPAI